MHRGAEEAVETSGAKNESQNFTKLRVAQSNEGLCSMTDVLHV